MVGIEQLKQDTEKLRNNLTNPLKLTSNYLDEFNKCVQCGYCRNVSGTFYASGKESDSHPGKMFTIKNFNNEKNDLKIIECIYHITSPGRAETVCPVNIKHEEAFIKLREKYFPKAVNMHEYSAMREALISLRDRTRENPFGKKKEFKQNWLSEIEHKRSDYLYFVGSNDLLSNHDKVRKILWLVNRFKIPYTISRDEPDSGYLAYMFGDSATARYYEERLRQIVESMLFKKIIVSCPHELDRLRKMFDGSRIEVMHIMELIDNNISAVGNRKIHKLRAKVAYLDSQHLSKYYSFNMPRNILRNIGCEIKEMVHSKEEAISCGAGEGFDIIYPKEAERIAVLHLNEATDAKADYLVTNDSYENALLNTVARKINSEVKVIDFIDLVVKAIKWSI